MLLLAKALGTTAAELLTGCVLQEATPDLNRQAEALFWLRWKLASEPDPNTWELVTPLDLPFVP